MPSSTSSSELPPFVRGVPELRWRAVALLALILVVVAVGACEINARSLGLRTVDIDDGSAFWAVERRKIDTGPRDQIAIIGDSRILFDTSLDVWQQTAGVRPIQLALVGTGALQFLQDLADDEHFAGMVVLGMAEMAYIANGSFNAKVLAYSHTQSPSQRVSHQIDLLLQRSFAFLDFDHALFSQIFQLHVPERAGVFGGYMSPWKMSESFADRQTTMWPRFEADAALRQHQVMVWDTPMEMYVKQAAALGPFPEPLRRAVVDATAHAVEKIRSRGGEVVFVRPPSSGYFLQAERILVPRAGNWDRLLRDSHSFGIYFEDYLDMRALIPTEQSHLNAADQKVFTRAYVSVLCQGVPWLQAHGARCTDAPHAPHP